MEPMPPDSTPPQRRTLSEPVHASRPWIRRAGKVGWLLAVVVSREDTIASAIKKTTEATARTVKMIFGLNN